MNNAHKKLTLSLATLGLMTLGLFFSAAATAVSFSVEAPRDSIESCVAEIGGHADYSGAGRVRHEIVKIGRRSLAYKFNIETTVFGADNGEVIRAYTTKCIIYGDDKPVVFEITETDASA